MVLLDAGMDSPKDHAGRCPVGLDQAVAEITASVMRRGELQDQRDREQDERRAQIDARLERLERVTDDMLDYLAGMCLALSEGYERLKKMS